MNFADPRFAAAHHTEVPQGAWPGGRAGMEPSPAWNGPRPPGAESANLGFADLLDVVNPLQHIPIVSHIYRAITGDEISTAARAGGGFLFGGPVGFVASLFDGIVTETTGEGAMEHAATALLDDGRDTAAHAVATAPEPPPRPAAVAAKQAARAAEAPEAKDTSQPADSAEQPAEGSSRLLHPASADIAPEAFAERMMDALEKYESLVREQNGRHTDETL